MTLEDAMDYETIVTRSQAEREIKRHGADFTEFISDYGDKTEYKASDVLAWLNY